MDYNNSGINREIKEGFVKVGSDWKKLQEIWVNVSGAWRKDEYTVLQPNTEFINIVAEDMHTTFDIDYLITIDEIVGASNYELEISVNNASTWSSVPLTNRQANINVKLYQSTFIRHRYQKEGSTAPFHVVRIGNLIDTGFVEDASAIANDNNWRDAIYDSGNNVYLGGSAGDAAGGGSFYVMTWDWYLPADKYTWGFYGKSVGASLSAAITVLSGGTGGSTAFTKHASINSSWKLFQWTAVSNVDMAIGARMIFGGLTTRVDCVHIYKRYPKLPINILESPYSTQWLNATDRPRDPILFSAGVLNSDGFSGVCIDLDSNGIDATEFTKIGITIKTDNAFSQDYRASFSDVGGLPEVFTDTTNFVNGESKSSAYKTFDFDILTLDRSKRYLWIYLNQDPTSNIDITELIIKN